MIVPGGEFCTRAAGRRLLEEIQTCRKRFSESPSRCEYRQYTGVEGPYVHVYLPVSSIGCEKRRIDSYLCMGN